MDDIHVEDGVRLQKVIARAGVASRRHAEVLIASGRVKVDGKVVRQLGVRVDPQRQIIHVDGNQLFLEERSLTIALNKPAGVVSTMDDPEGRPCLREYVEGYGQRLFHVGRLDTDTSGLILLTNDGELAHRLTHPSWQVPKTYVATVHGEIPRGLKRRLEKGVELEDGVIKVDDFRLNDTYGEMSIVQLTLHEGRNRVVRRLLDAVGFPVIELVRTEFGPVRIGRLHSGVTRKVTGDVLMALYRSVDL